MLNVTGQFEILLAWLFVGGFPFQLDALSFLKIIKTIFVNYLTNYDKKKIK